MFLTLDRYILIVSTFKVLARLIAKYIIVDSLYLLLFIYLFIYLKSLKLYKVAHPTRGVLRLKEYVYTKFINKKYQGIKET